MEIWYVFGGDRKTVNQDFSFLFVFDFQGLVLHHPVEFNASAFTVGKGISPAEKGKGTFSDRVGNNELTSGIETAEILAILGIYPVEFFQSIAGSAEILVPVALLFLPWWVSVRKQRGTE